MRHFCKNIAAAALEIADWNRLPRIICLFRGKIDNWGIFYEKTCIDDRRLVDQPGAEHRVARVRTNRT